MSVALFWLPIANELWMLYLFAVAFGFAYGNIIALLALAPVEFFGLRSLGVILGTIVFSYTIGGAAGPAVVGYIFDITGTYYQAFWVIAAIALVGCMLAVLLELPCKQENIKEMN